MPDGAASQIRDRVTALDAGYFLLEISPHPDNAPRIAVMKNFWPKLCSVRESRRVLALAALMSAHVAIADCSLTNLGIKPLPEMGLGTYLGFNGGLYPGGANQRPPTHEAAGIAIAESIQPLDAAGNVDTNAGKIVLLSLGMSNTTMEWATWGPSHFTALATNDPSLNPPVLIVDGAISGNDATRWTNITTSTNWDYVITQRLASAGVTTNQVQVLWLKEALQHANDYGAFPLHAQHLQQALGKILRNAKAVYPNLKLAYLAPRTRSYTSDATAPNPEPFAFETGYAAKWIIEDQITGDTNLNWNLAAGPVVAPWISWGAYTWADGVVPRSDGLTWLCSDVFGSPDFTHPTFDGVEKVARQLLSFFKTDPTTTPWFLKTNSPDGPSCAPSASVTMGTAPLTVNFSSNPTWGSAPMHDAQWTFDDGESSTNLNPVKIFPTPGVYHVHHTITDTNGNTAKGTVAIAVTSAYPVWTSDVFTQPELANASISGVTANPDGDTLVNLLEYAMACGPKTFEQWPAVTLSNGVVSLSYPRLKTATDVTLTLQSSTDFTNWATAQPTSVRDNGLLQMITVRQSASTNGPRFFRLRAFK